MNFIRLLISFICIIHSTSHANKDYEMFLKGNQACKQGRYIEAANIYEKISVQSAAILYNTGYARYGLGDYKGALIVWRQAERLAAGALFKKVRIALDKALIKTDQELDGLYYRFLIYLQAGIWLGTLQLITLFILGLLIFFMYCGYAKIHLNIRGKLIFITMIIGLFLCSITLFAHYYIQGTLMGRWAVVSDQQISVFAMPHVDAHIVGTVSGGALVKLVDENGAWCKMHYPRAKGWIQKAGVHPLKSA